MNNPKPKLPTGFTTRPAKMRDLETVVDMLNRFSKVYLGITPIEKDEIRNEWQIPGFELKNDTRVVFTTQGILAGYVEVWTLSNPPVHPWVWGRTHPDYEGLGVGTYLISWAEERARQAIKRTPDEARVAYRTGIDTTVEPAKELFKDMDLKLIRHSFRMLIEMDAMPPEPRWAEGIQVRTYNPEEDAEAVYRADVEAFRDHFGFIEQPFEEDFERFMHHMTQKESYDPSLWFLAMDGDEIAGFCLCHKWAHEDKETGYVSGLGVRRAWRQRGIGLALLRHSFREFYQRGKRKVALGVDAENLTGALRLYKKAGMHIHRQFDLYEKELRPGVELSVQTLE
ncbi:MAG: GNAT family N-acetyltransferase [Anaerolineales bacterium]